LCSSSYVHCTHSVNIFQTPKSKNQEPIIGLLRAVRSAKNCPLTSVLFVFEHSFNRYC